MEKVLRDRILVSREGLNQDELVKSLLERHPGEPRIRSGAGAGVQNILK